MKYRKKEGYRKLDNSSKVCKALLDGHVIADCDFDGGVAHFWRMSQDTGEFELSREGGIVFEPPGDLRHPSSQYRPYYVVEELKEKLCDNGLWKKPALEGIPFGDLSPKIPLGHLFGDHKQCDAWRRALTTFVDLKSLDYCRPVEDDEKQYFIELGYRNNCGVLLIDNYESWGLKLVAVSPMFSDRYFAANAIKEIGEDKLLHMFKTFQGIYDE